MVVGSGSAGAALAARLSEDGRHSVCVIEYGGSDASPFVQMPGALSIPMNSPRYDWGFHTEPEPGLGGRRIHQARGKVIGGTSSINGMVWVRGHPLDFERWVEEGAAGWGYADVLPYFQRAETYAGGGDAYRGGEGPMRIRPGSMENPLHAVFLEAARQAGYAITSDYNGARQEGFGAMQMSVHDGVRWSTANAYLKPALKRPNLALITRALARRVIFDGARATGVEIERGGAVEVVHADREVVLSAGAFGSPHLLLLSGVGPGAELAAHGVNVVADRPGVGANLQDHLEFWLQVACGEPVSLFGATALWRKGLIGLQWLRTRRGLGASNQFESCGFIRSRAGRRFPDIQYHFLPLAVAYDGSSIATRHGYQAHVGPNHPRSRGRLWLKSADPREKPAMRFNYLADEEDRADMRAALRLTREIFAQPAFAPFDDGEILPGREVVSDDDIDAFVRDRAESAYHPCGAARMGRRDDPLAVVDPECRVIGVERLRVVDSSVIPSLTNGNLNAPTIMIGEKAADHILGRALLPRSNQAYFVDEEWRTRQRAR